MRAMPDNCIAAVVTDPPYGLSKEPDMAEVLRHWLAGDDYQHNSRGFMGKTWDSFVPGPSVWREVLRVLKPGGHVLSFSGTRTYDLSVLAMRLAGFEIRDQLAWLYGTGFPKSLDVSKAIDAVHGASGSRGPMKRGGERLIGHAERDGEGRWGDETNRSAYTYVAGTPEAQRWSGWGTALKPAQEPIVLARKPLIGTIAANVLAHGTGGINVDACRIEGGSTRRSNTAEMGYHGGNLAESYETGSDAGRWPANVLFDEEAAAALDKQTGITTSPTKTGRGAGGQHGITPPRGAQGEVPCCGDTGGASRFFYVAKASPSEREAGLDHLPVRSGGELTDREDGSDGLNSPRAGAGRGGGRRNHHPTVKPIELMRYLIRLITPPGGIVLDPFAGSGTTGVAAALEGFDFLGFELMADYAEIARARIRHHGGTIGEV